MKYTFYLLIFLLAGFTSCKKEKQPMSPQTMQHKIDSLTAVRIRESDDMARRDLEDRMKIEVKVKVDSIVNARLNPVKKDTAHAAKALPTPPTPTVPPVMPPQRIHTSPKDAANSIVPKQ